MKKFAVKYLKHIIKESFGNVGVRKLKISYVGDILIYSNLYYIGGFFIKVTVNLDDYKATVLFYDYYGEAHPYLKNKTVSSIDSVLSGEGRYCSSKYWKNDLNLQERVFTLPYNKELLYNYYSFIKEVKKNLNYGKTYYYGDGYNNSRFELRYAQNLITVVQGDCEIPLKDILTYNKNEIIEKINFLRGLNLEGVSFKISAKNFKKDCLFKK